MNSNKNDNIILEINNLRKRYASYDAVKNIDFFIHYGECFGLLGSNGAGKTTVIKMIATLCLPSEGDIFFDGEKLTRDNINAKRQIGLITQEYSLRKDFTVEEIMMLHGKLYQIPIKECRKRSEELLEEFDLFRHRKKNVRQLSGGMKRKLMLCRAIMTKPKLLLLDEPTVGMDPIARQQLWDHLRRLNKNGTAMLLTTHYIEEAHAICGRVAMMKEGKIIICDSPLNLINKVGRYTVEDRTLDKIELKNFSNREEAVTYAEKISGDYFLRETNLEDVYIEVMKRNEGV